MPAPASLPSPVPSVADRIAPLVDWLAVVAGPVGSAVLVGGRGPFPDHLVRLRSLATLGSGSGLPAGLPLDPYGWAALPCLLSLLAAYALWTRRRWLVWTLAGVAAVAAFLGAAAGGLAFVPLAGLLTVAAGLRARRASRATTDQPDVTL